MNDPNQQTELARLKEEVATLWKRYRHEEPLSDEGDTRRQLADAARALELQRRQLTERRAVLLSTLDADHRDAARFLPLVRGAGIALGLGSFALLLPSLLPVVSELSCGFTRIHGAIAVVLASFTVPLLVRTYGGVVPR